MRDIFIVTWHEVALGKVRLLQNGGDQRGQVLPAIIRFCRLAILVVGFAFCGLSYAEQIKQPGERVSVNKENLISVTLGDTILKLPAPVHLDGKWINYDAKGKELNFPIQAAKLYKSFAPAAESSPDLLREKFQVSLTYVKGVDRDNRKSDELSYIKDGRWEKIYPDTALGLLVYERTPRLARGWGAATYYPLDEKYLAPDGLPFRISCNRVDERSLPVGCRFHYFIGDELSMTFNFLHVDKHLKNWRELDQALRQTLYFYMEKKK